MITTSHTVTEALADKIRSGVLKGRSVLKRIPVTEKATTPEEDRATVEKFAFMLDLLSSARGAMDNARRLAKDSEGIDLADRIFEDKDLPDLSRIGSDADAAKLRAKATLQACNRYAPKARTAIVGLSNSKKEVLAKLTLEARASIERPSWISDALFEQAVATHPAVQALVAFEWIQPPLIPLLTDEGGKLRLPNYRIEEISEIQKLGAHNGDCFNPSQLAHSLREWLKHIDELSAYGTVKD